MSIINCIGMTLINYTSHDHAVALAIQYYYECVGECQSVLLQKTFFTDLSKLNLYTKCGLLDSL